MAHQDGHRNSPAEPSGAEDRRFERETIKKNAILYSHDRTQSVVIRDISCGSMKIQNAFGLMPSDVVRIEHGLRGLEIRRAAIQGLIAELTTPTYDLTAWGKLVVQSKFEMKKDGRRSPDIADAFLMTFGGGSYPREDSSDMHLSRHRYREPVRDPWSY
jgi:hypothetical protein